MSSCLTWSLPCLDVLFYIRYSDTVKSGEKLTIRIKKIEERLAVNRKAAPCVAHESYSQDECWEKKDQEYMTRKAGWNTSSNGML